MRCIGRVPPTRQSARRLTKLFFFFHSPLMHGYGARRLKPAKTGQDNNFREFPTTIVSSQRYGLIEVFRGHSSLVLSFLIFGRSDIRLGGEWGFEYPIILGVLCK